MSSFLSYITPAALRRRSDVPPGDDQEVRQGDGGVSPLAAAEEPRSRAPLAAVLFPLQENNKEENPADPPVGDDDDDVSDQRSELDTKHDAGDDAKTVSMPVSFMSRLLDMIEQEKLKSKESTLGTTMQRIKDRGRLPKIEYSKLVTLSLTNFAEYKEAIKVLGYAREWPKQYAAPTLDDLKVAWSGADKDTLDGMCRSEAFLVLYQTIPASLKYLVENVKEGDVLAVWKILYGRFMQVTKLALKQMKQEWESLSQQSRPVDEFISVVAAKAKAMRMVGVNISEEEEATALLCGLHDSFDTVKQYFNLVGSYTFEAVSKAATNYAIDKKMFAKKSTATGQESIKSPCLNFNAGSCPRKNCRYQHVKVSDKVLKKLKDEIALKKKNTAKGSKALTVQSFKQVKCFKCLQNGHVVKNCPNKEKVDGFLKTLKVKDDGAAAIAKEEGPMVMPCFVAKEVNGSNWVLDSGATQHITNRIEWMMEASPVVKGSVSFTVGNEQEMMPTHVGAVMLGLVKLTNVYFCASCPLNLMSEGRLLACGADVMKTSKDGKALVTKAGKELFRGELRKNLFVITQAYDGAGKVLNVSTVYDGQDVKTDVLGVAFNGSKLMDFHAKWGHLNFKECIKELKMDAGRVKELVCPECELTKSRRKSRPREAETRADQPAYRLHADLSGRKLSSLQGYRYFLVVTDDYSRYKWVRLLSKKNEAAKELKSLIEEIEREKAPLKVAVIRTDGGGEFVNQDFDSYLKEKGVRHEKSAPHSQFQNGVAERTIGVLDESARAMMMLASSPTYDWCHAVVHAAYCRNRVPTKSIAGLVPIEVYAGVQRRLRDPMPIYGCLGYAKQYIRGKQDPKAKRVVFLCSSDEYKADYVRDISSFDSSLKEFYSRDVKYDTRIFPYRSRLVPRPVVPPQDDEDVKEALKIQDALDRQRQQDEVQVLDVDEGEDGVPKWEVERIVDKRVSRFGPRSLSQEEKGFDYKVVWKPEGMYPDSWEPAKNLDGAEEVIRAYEDSVGEESVVDAEAPLRRSSRLNAAMSLFEKDPTTRQEALASPQCQEWLDAEAEELKSIQERGVWTLVDPEPGMNVLGSRFVYKTKRKPDGVIERFKARLVAQGFKQKEGVDFNDVFATTVAWQSVRIILWLAVFYKMVMAKVDIKTFFLYGDLQETIYMKQPPGYAQGQKVCRLVKSLYGLKQSMRCALETLTKVLMKQDVLPLVTDPNVFFRKCQDGVLIVSAWVDDLLCCCSSKQLLDEFVKILEESFQLTVEYDPSDYLQMQIERDVDERKFKMHQGGYIQRLLKNFRMENCNSQKLPMTQGVLPSPSEVVPAGKEVPYMELVGSLIWLLRTRLDLSVAVNILARYMSRYDETVYQHALKILKYLKGCPDDGIVYDLSASRSYEYGQGVEASFEVDSNWGGSCQDSKSTTGWLLKLNDTVVGSQTKNQSRPAVSTGEAELNGLEFVGKEVEWTGDFLNELKIEAPRPFKVWQDNAAALALTKDPVMRPRTKYFRIAQHYVRWLQVIGKAEYLHKAGKDLTADFLTKLQPYPRFSRDKLVLMGPQDVFSRQRYAGMCNLMLSTNDFVLMASRAVLASRRDQERRLSCSSHDPALVASCPKCMKFLKWIPDRDEWQLCECEDARCYCCSRSVCVTCVQCDGVAWFHRLLKQWLCYHCNADAGVRTRSRRNRRGLCRDEGVNM